MKVSSLSEIGLRALNEDTVFIDKHRGLFAVFDGASSLDDYKNEQGETGGYIASRSASETFQHSTAQDLKALFQEANSQLEALHKQAGIDTSDAVHRFGTTIAAAWVHQDTIEFLQCADSVAIIVDASGNASTPLGYHDQDLSEMLEWQRLARSGLKATEIKPLIRPLTIEKRRIVNTTFGTMNGDPKAENFAFHMIVPIASVKHIFLLTDGMYIPKEDPSAEEDWQRYADILLTSGPEGLFSTVRAAELSDPDIIRYPRYKLHDDASAIAISL